MRPLQVGITGQPRLVDTYVDLARDVPGVELVPGSPATLARARLPTLAIPPLATSLEVADRIAARFRDAGIPLVVDQLYRFQPSHAGLRSQLSAGRLGDLLYVHLRCRNQRPEPHPRLAFLRLASIQFDLLNWLWPRQPTSVEVSRVDASGREPQLTWTYVTLEDGALGVLEIGWNLPGRDLERQLPVVDLHLMGSQGAAETQSAAAALRLVTDDGWMFPDTTSQGAFRSQLDHFRLWLDQGGSEHPSVGESRSALVLALVAWSRQQGRRRSLPPREQLRTGAHPR